MIVELESGVVIRIFAKDVTVFCNCVLSPAVIQEIKDTLTFYKREISDAKIYIPNKFTRYYGAELDLKIAGMYPKYVKGAIDIGGYIYEVQ